MHNALRFAKTKIVISTSDDGICVSNDGEKIEENILENLFKRFERGELGETGLGLAICKRISHQYGYSIKAENLEMVTFTVYNDVFIKTK